MIITEAQRFIYGFLALACITIFVLVLLHVYALEFFLILLIIEFLVVAELTEPHLFHAAWRKNIIVVIIVCAIVGAIIIYQRVTP